MVHRLASTFRWSGHITPTSTAFASQATGFPVNIGIVQGDNAMPFGLFALFWLLLLIFGLILAFAIAIAIKAPKSPVDDDKYERKFLLAELEEIKGYMTGTLDTLRSNSSFIQSPSASSNVDTSAMIQATLTPITTTLAGLAEQLTATNNMNFTSIEQLFNNIIDTISKASREVKNHQDVATGIMDKQTKLTAAVEPILSILDVINSDIEAIKAKQGDLVPEMLRSMFDQIIAMLEQINTKFEQRAKLAEGFDQVKADQEKHMDTILAAVERSSNQQEATLKAATQETADRMLPDIQGYVELSLASMTRLMERMAGTMDEAQERQSIRDGTLSRTIEEKGKDLDTKIAKIDEWLSVMSEGIANDVGQTKQMINGQSAQIETLQKAMRAMEQQHQQDLKALSKQLSDEFMRASQRPALTMVAKSTQTKESEPTASSSTQTPLPAPTTSTAVQTVEPITVPAPIIDPIQFSTPVPSRKLSMSPAQQQIIEGYNSTPATPTASSIFIVTGMEGKDPSAVTLPVSVSAITSPSTDEVEAPIVPTLSVPRAALSVGASSPSQIPSVPASNLTDTKAEKPLEKCADEAPSPATTHLGAKASAFKPTSLSPALVKDDTRSTADSSPAPVVKSTGMGVSRWAQGRTSTFEASSPRPRTAAAGTGLEVQVKLAQAAANASDDADTPTVKKWCKICKDKVDIFVDSCFDRPEQQLLWHVHSQQEHVSCDYCKEEFCERRPQDKVVHERTCKGKLRMEREKEEQKKKQQDEQSSPAVHTEFPAPTPSKPRETFNGKTVRWPPAPDPENKTGMAKCRKCTRWFRSTGMGAHGKQCTKVTCGHSGCGDVFSAAYWREVHDPVCKRLKDHERQAQRIGAPVGSSEAGPSSSPQPSTPKTTGSARTEQEELTPRQAQSSSSRATASPWGDNVIKYQDDAKGKEKEGDKGKKPKDEFLGKNPYGDR